MMRLFLPITAMKQDSWLYSDSFLKRAFAIWGHYTVANLIIALPIALISFMVALMIMPATSTIEPAL